MTPLNITPASSPNHDERPPGTPVDHLVLHYTGMQSGPAALRRLRDPAPPTNIPVSAHYLIEEDGQIFQLVPDTRRAWHAGISHWRGHSALNARSIGIEIVNPGHEWGYRPFPTPQIDALITLCIALLARHPIPQTNIVAHSDIAPDRKQDPGELFPWPTLAQSNIGLWPTTTPPPIPPDAVEPTLRAIGYPVPDLPTTLRAFQRRWLPTDLSGKATPGTCARLAAVHGAYGLSTVTALPGQDQFV